MELNFFKDKLFDILNDSEEIDICNITADDPEDLFKISVADGSTFEILCRKA